MASDSQLAEITEAFAGEDHSGRSSPLMSPPRSAAGGGGSTGGSQGKRPRSLFADIRPGPAHITISDNSAGHAHSRKRRRRVSDGSAAVGTRRSARSQASTLDAGGAATAASTSTAAATATAAAATSHEGSTLSMAITIEDSQGGGYAHAPHNTTTAATTATVPQSHELLRIASTASNASYQSVSSTQPQSDEGLSPMTAATHTTTTTTTTTNGADTTQAVAADSVPHTTAKTADATRYAPGTLLLCYQGPAGVLVDTEPNATVVSQPTTLHFPCPLSHTCHGSVVSNQPITQYCHMPRTLHITHDRHVRAPAPTHPPTPYMYAPIFTSLSILLFRRSVCCRLH